MTTDTSTEAVESECRNIHDAITRKMIPAVYGTRWQDIMRALAAERDALIAKMETERADMIPREKADARVAAAYEAAAKSLVSWFFYDDTYSSQQADDIRALTPDDAIAALEAMLADAEKRGEKRAHDALVVVPAASKEQEHAIQMCQAAIRAEAEAEE